MGKATSLRLALWTFVIVLAAAALMASMRFGSQKGFAERAEANRRFEEGRATKESEDRCSSTHLAYIAAKDFMKASLKAPATADFPPFRDVTVIYKENCTHAVTGFVDAQNSFGATIRTRYQMVVQNQKGSERWDLVSTKLLDENRVSP